MIHKIVIENFFSVADRQEIVLKAPGNAPDMPCFRPSHADPDERLPLVVGFFGPNASGKSTILRAVVAATAFARESFTLPIDGTIPFFQPYMRKDWMRKPSIIEVEFDGHISVDQPASLFRYTLHIAHNFESINPSPFKTVAYEALFHAPKGKFRKIFERKGQGFSFGKEFGITDSDPRVLSIRSNASTISTLAQLNHKQSMDFKSFLAGIKTNIAGYDRAQGHANQMLPFYSENPVYLEHLIQELQRLDVGLETMKIEQGNMGTNAMFKHVGLDMPIYMNEESAGTRRFIEIFPRLQYVLETGSVALIDELDMDLHPLLIPELFRWFSDKQRNPHGAQLFFTAHNPALLDELEKEQIFFTEKPSGEPSRVYGARDIKGLRREPSLMKKYLGGELGAVPHIG
ncbi:MAG: ATP-binding protein [Alphaproteobacteria bacterium]